MKLPGQVVYTCNKDQVRYSLGSGVMKPWATLYNWKELEENREAWNRAEETAFSDQELMVPLETSSGDYSRFSFIIQHMQLCKPQIVSDHAHPYEVVGYDMMKGKASPVSSSVRNPMRTHVHQDPLITKPGQKADMLRWGGMTGVGLRRNDQKFFFQTSNLFFYTNYEW